MLPIFDNFRYNSPLKINTEGIAIVPVELSANVSKTPVNTRQRTPKKERDKDRNKRLGIDDNDSTGSVIDVCA